MKLQSSVLKVMHEYPGGSPSVVSTKMRRILDQFTERKGDKA